MLGMPAAGYRSTVRIFLQAPTGERMELLPVRALDQDGWRVFHGYGPPGEAAPTRAEVVVEPADPDRDPPADDARVLVRTGMDVFGILRFEPGRPPTQTNN